MRLTKEYLSADWRTFVRGQREQTSRVVLREDWKALADELDRLFQVIEDTFDKVVDAVNANDGSSICTDVDAALPTAALEYLGRLVTLRKSAPAADELHYCYKNGAGAFVCFKIV